MLLRFLAAALMLLISAACGPATRSPHSEVSIAAASDLKFALDELVARFAALHPSTRVTVAYGSSGHFYSQLANHAPFDLFLSADLEFPRNLDARGLTLPDTQFHYATGRVVLWTPSTSPVDVRELQISALRHPSVAHIAIANPQHAPYGRAAAAVLRSYGLYETVQPRLVLGESVAQALQFVQSGNAQIGIVALSLALAPTVASQGRYWEIPMHRYPRLDQGGVILKWARSPEAARAFRDFLLHPEASAILEQHGFLPPKA